MTKARILVDLISSGGILSDGIITASEITNLQVDRYSEKTISENQTLDADTQYLTGRNMTVNSAATLTLPSDTLLEIELYNAGKAL